MSTITTVEHFCDWCGEIATPPQQSLNIITIIHRYYDTIAGSMVVGKEDLCMSCNEKINLLRKGLLDERR
jgi:hypothetical protein